MWSGARTHLRSHQGQRVSRHRRQAGQTLTGSRRPGRLSLLSPWRSARSPSLPSMTVTGMIPLAVNVTSTPAARRRSPALSRPSRTTWPTCRTSSIAVRPVTPASVPLDRLLRTRAGGRQNTVLMRGAGSGILKTWKPAGADCDVCAAVDVHYLRTGGARAAAVLAADAAFAHVMAERTAVVPRVPPYRPGEFYLRELPPMRAVLDDLRELGPAGGRWLCRSGPWRPTRPGCACARRVRHPGHRSGQVPVPHGYPCGAGGARILGTPAVRHGGRDARSRRG